MKGRILILSVCLLFFHFFESIKSDFPGQPKIYNHDGTLILEAAWDKNLTLRLVHDSDLYFGDVNVLDEVRQLLLARSKNGGEKNGALPASIDEMMPTAEMLTNKVRELKRDVFRLGRRLNLAQNRTNGPAQQRRLRRFLGRIRRAEARISQLDELLITNDCEKDHVNVCKNGGTCYDGYKSFHCECTEGWTGPTCEEDVDECYILTGTDLGCQNNGVCVNTDGSYRCVCQNGFTGTHCRIKNATCENAQASEICGHGTCVQVADGQKGGYSCLCDQGWTKNNVTLACIIDVDECALPTNPCHNGCLNLPGSFRCEPCPSGYQGNGITCKDIDECAMNNGGCSLQPKVKCINTEGSYRCGNCPIGYTGDGRNCEMEPSNTCETANICHPRAKCEYISDTVVCTCPLGLYGHGFGAKGCTSEANATDPCAQHECKNNGICTVMGRGTTCICQTGFMGAQCEQADACQAHPCQNGGTCKLLPGNHFSCTCERGTTGKKCEILREICGSILRQESGELSYPAAGDHYEPYERCAWMITTAESKVLNVTFTKFDLEEPEKADGECRKDWLQVHDGNVLTAPLIGRFCGKKLPLDGSTLQSSHQQLLFWFRSDNSTHGGGFTITWTSQAHQCGGSFELNEDDTGVIRSPGYPGKTSANRNCEWKLSAPFGYRLILRVYEVVLGSLRNSNCTQDSLKIYDSDLLLRAICESSQPEPLHTSSNKAIVRLHTDGYLSDSAFQLHYEVVPGTPHCGGLFTEPEGIISGFMNARLCEYLIQQPPGMKIELNFQSMNLMKSTDCVVHKIEVFNGKTEDDPLLKRLCGHEGLNEPLVSSSNFMLLRYEFLLPVPLAQEFKAKYKRTCDDRLFGPEGGILTTPNYPNPYYDHITCTYDIYGPSSMAVHVNFTDFSISETIPNPMETINDNATTIYGNYVEVYLSNNNRRVFYKSAPFLNLVSEKNRIRIVFHAVANSQKARGLRIEYDFERVGCGGVLTENENSFARIGSLSNMPAYCEWFIEAPANKHILLEFKYKRYGTPCEANEANLFVYANSTNGESKLLQSFCGRDGDGFKEPILSSMVTIILKKPLNAPHTPFSFFGSYNFTDSSEDCGGTFNAQYGIIRSPGWPQNYRPFAECVWRLNAPLGHQIELVVKDFTLEFSCDDYLEIRNGIDEHAPLIGKYCGTKIPSRIPSFANHLYLHFKSDRYIEDIGFYLIWQQTRTGCGGRLNAFTGSIHPPMDTGEIACDWFITVAQGSIIELKLSELGEELDICERKPSLMIYDGLSTTNRLIPWNCNSTLNNHAGNDVFKIRSTQNQIFVRYQTQQNANKYFLLEYQTICENIRADGLLGVIESPNFPELYPPNLACSWDIRGGKNNRISLSFSHLELEQRSSACHMDYVEINDMRDDVLVKKLHFCTQPLEAYESEGNRLLVKFTTDYSMSERGFRLEYKRLGCGQHFGTSYGSFSTPLAPYSVDIDCDWYIEAPAGKQIILNFIEIHIETESSDCTKDLLIVSETKTNSTLLLHECKVERSSIRLTSPSNRLYIHFHTSAKRTRKYFRASYFYMDAKCGGIYHSPSGMITSPNYPDIISNVECVWTITVDATFGISIDFIVIDIPASANCSEASIELSTQDKVVQPRSCGENIKKSFFTERINFLTVRLRVSAVGSAKFAFHYEKQCGGEITTPSGYLNALPNQDCEWRIKSNDGALISLDILNLECPCPIKNSGCGLQVSISPSRELNTSTAYAPLCESSISNFMAETLLIQARHINFRAKYSTLQNTCGGIITSFSGILRSPKYLSVYPANMECIWEIKASSGNMLELNFISMNIVDSPLCNEDFLEIRDAETGGNQLAVYCGTKMPSAPLVFNEKVWLKFKSAANSIGAQGFKLSWAYAHSVELNVTSGTLESPPVRAVQTEEEPFNWRIHAPRGKLLHVKFKAYSQGLKIFDGYDDSALELELQYSPWEFFSSSNVIYITTINSELEYFLITWTLTTSDLVANNATIKECHETIDLSMAGFLNISSPGYPFGYKRNLDCEWIVKPKDPTYHVVLNLFEANLEDMTNCVADFVRVSTSTDLVNWHERLLQCKTPPFSYTPKFVVHGHPYLKINFHSDPSINGSGFTSWVYPACGSNMSAPVGTILDTNLWRVRIVNSTCTWHINVRPGKIIQFSFDYGNTELRKKNENCKHYALIYDGIDTNAPILQPGQICNHPDRNVKIIKTTSNHAVVTYNISWPFGQRSLWNLTYREYSECDGEIMLTHLANWFNISSPRYPNVPQPHTECNWIIVAPPGEALRADFIGGFDMNVRYCSKEYIEFHDGSTILARSLGRFCRRTGTILSSGNLMHIRYLTDISDPSNGFQLNVSIATCGGTVHALYGDITSTRYPALGGYARGTVCEWAIVLQKSSRIRLNFTDVDLPYNSKDVTSSDRLEIETLSEKPEKLAVYYGNLTQVPVLDIDSNSVVIRFYSLALDNSKYRGFKLKYNRLFGNCFRDFNSDSGRILLNRSLLGNTYQICRWRITVPRGQRVSLQITKLIGQSPNNSTQALPALRRGLATTASTTSTFSFYNDNDMFSKITQFNINEYNSSMIIRSTDNTMLVRIQMANYGFFINKIEAIYSSNDESACPHDIPSESSKGEINLQTAILVEKSFYCRSQFKLSGQETITIQLEELQVQSQNNFSTQYAVRIRNEDSFLPFRVLNKNVTNTLISLSPTRGSISWMQTDVVRIKRFAAKYFRNPCGGTLIVADNLNIDYPSIDQLVSSSSSSTLECVWTLRSYAVAVKYQLAGNTSFVDSCEREYIAIYGGMSKEYEQIGLLCRDSPVLNGTSLQRGLTLLVYHSEEYKPRQSNFQLLIEKTIKCGSKLSVHGSIDPPITIDSKAYKNNFDCTWEFETTVGLLLSVNFKGRFFVEDSVQCTKDYLQVLSYEGGLWMPLARFCGREVPATFNTSSANIMLAFHTDNAVTGDGFSFIVKSDCNAIYNVTEETKVIRFPKHIPSQVGLRCKMIFQTNSAKIMNIRIRNAYKDEESTTRYYCEYASFTVTRRNENYNAETGTDTNSGSKIEQYCNTVELRASNYLKVDYYEVLDVGYYIEYDLNICGGNITAPRTIRSVQEEKADRYIGDMNCVWYVKAPQDHSVVIHFKYFDLEYHLNCKYDYVAFYKGAILSEDKIVTRICGNLTNDPPVIVIDSNQAVITAISDATNTQRGFLASIAFVPNCNERITLSDGNSPVTLSRQFKFNISEELLCYYRVIAPEGYRVSIQLHELELNTVPCSNKNCSNCNHLELLDSIGVKRASIGKYCANGRVNVQRLSSYEDAMLKLSGKSPGEFSFEIVLKKEPTACGIKNYKLQGMEEVKLSFPSTASAEKFYAPNTHCAWHIEADDEFTIKFTSIQLQNVSQVTGECIDYLEINFDYSSKRFCGNSTGFELHVIKRRTTFADIIFHSDESIESKGFSLIATHRYACNRTFTSLSGELSYSGYFVHKDHCNDEIRVPDNFVLIIQIKRLYFDEPTQCNNETMPFKLIDLHTNKTLLSACRDTYQTKSIITTTNAVRISVLSIAGKNYDFRLNYYVNEKTAQPGCGGHFVSLEGSFSNPTYDNDHNSSVCRWEIVVPASNQLWFYSYDFDMGSITNCNLDYVQFFAIQPNGSQQLSRKLCGQNFEQNGFIVNSNHVLVVANKSPNFDGTGFEISYRTRENENAMSNQNSYVFP